jgi:hypothetical protein
MNSENYLCKNPHADLNLRAVAKDGTATAMIAQLKVELHFLDPPIDVLYERIQQCPSEEIALFGATST